MSYDVAIWCGPAPESDEAALALMRRLRSSPNERATEPVADLVALVGELRARFPSDDEESCVFSSTPPGNVVGGFVYLDLVRSRAEAVSSWLAERAWARGLTVFDPQTERVLTKTFVLAIFAWNERFATHARRKKAGVSFPDVFRSVRAIGDHPAIAGREFASFDLEVVGVLADLPHRVARLPNARVVEFPAHLAPTLAPRLGRLAWKHGMTSVGE